MCSNASPRLRILQGSLLFAQGSLLRAFALPTAIQIRRSNWPACDRDQCLLNFGSQKSELYSLTENKSFTAFTAVTLVRFLNYLHSQKHATVDKDNTSSDLHTTECMANSPSCSFCIRNANPVFRHVIAVFPRGTFKNHLEKFPELSLSQIVWSPVIDKFVSSSEQQFQEFVEQ